MATYRLGSRGQEVRAIQEKVAALGDYRGPIDGDFGGGTHAAIIAFQRRGGIEPDGRVRQRPGRRCSAARCPSP